MPRYNDWGHRGAAGTPTTLGPRPLDSPMARFLEGQAPSQLELDQREILEEDREWVQRDKERRAKRQQQSLAMVPAPAGTVISATSAVSSRLRTRGLVTADSSIAACLSQLSPSARSQLQKQMWEAGSDLWRNAESSGPPTPRPTLPPQDKARNAAEKADNSTKNCNNEQNENTTWLRPDIRDEVEGLIARQRHHLLEAVDCDYRMRELFWENVRDARGEQVGEDEEAAGDEAGAGVEAARAATANTNDSFTSKDLF